MSRKIKPYTPKTKYKRYSLKQMYSFVRSSRDKRAKAYWFKRAYNKKISVAKKYGNTQAVEYLKEVKKRGLSKVRKGLLNFNEKKFRVATKSDIERLMIEGITPKNNPSIMLVVDANNQAEIIAYAGTEAYEEALEHRQELFGTTSDLELSDEE